MRKLILLFGGIPASIRRIIGKILPVTTKILAALESGVCEDIVALIPGTLDNEVRDSLIIAVSQLQKALKQVTDTYARKQLMGTVAATALSWADGHQHPISEYRNIFDKVFAETNA